MDREKIDYDRMMSTQLKDWFGFEIKVGDMLARAAIWYHSTPCLQRCVVTKISNGRIYLDNSKVPIQHPGRCINISHLRTM